MKKLKIPVFFHRDQLEHKPLFEWAFGEKIAHPETTSRAESILKAIEEESERFELFAPNQFPLEDLKELHHRKLIEVIKNSKSLPSDKTFYPSVFPKRDQASADPKNIYHAGFFCYDSGTPLNSTTWAAAAWSAACAREATEWVFEGKSKISYALCRPPGHHASRDLFGGYCYFNNAAIAAKRLKEKGRVVVLDIDFHHGNGTQSLFYKDPDVFVISIHGDPREYYPFFSGYENEIGKGDGEGFNLNLPRPTGLDRQGYIETLEEKVLPAILKYRPRSLVVSAGFDTYVADPIGGFALETHDYPEISGRLKKLGLPTVVVQEGGYAAESLGRNVVSFLEGLRD